MSGKILEMLERRSVGICSVQEIRFSGNSFKMISGKAAKRMIFCVGNGVSLGGIGIFLAKKWADKAIDISMVSNRMIGIKALIQRIIIYASQCRLDDSPQDDFYNSLTNNARNINNARKLGENEIVVIAGEFNDKIGNNTEIYEDQHGGYSYRVRNNEGEKILEFSVTMYITIGNTLFKKRVNYLVIHKAGPSTTQLSYFLLSRNQRKCLKDIKLLPSIDFLTQHNTVV